MRKIVIGVVVGVAALSLTACGHSTSTATSPAAAADTTVDVGYHVTGTANMASITISTANGGTSQQSDVDVPLRNKAGKDGLHFAMKEGAFAYISAQNSGEFGTVTCEIRVNGVVAVTNTSSGAYAIATCSGRV